MHDGKVPVRHISSPSNPLVKQLRRLSHHADAYRRVGRVLIEGDHLCRALVARGLRPAEAVLTPAAWADASLRQLALSAPQVTVVDEAVMRSLSALESPASLAFVHVPPQEGVLHPDVHSVVLDRVQDAGNVGAILRCAAALGAAQVVALSGTAALWSPKVLRAGMGAHFGLNLLEAATPEVLEGLRVPLLATSPHGTAVLHHARLPYPCAWVFGHEGQGVATAVARRCEQVLRIAQPGGEESLNVAAAAAICLHESVRQRA